MKKNLNRHLGSNILGGYDILQLWLFFAPIVLEFLVFSAKAMLTNYPARNWKLKEDFYDEVPVEATACET